MMLNSDKDGWELLKYGFKKLGKNVQISDKAVFYGAQHISIGDNSRIDDFVILSAGEAGIDIRRHVHIACGVSIIGKGKVTMDDYSAISGKSSVYSSSDPYDGSLMTNPTIPEPLRQTYHEPVFLGKHVVVGAGSVILPGVMLSDGCAVGAMSLVTKTFPYNTIIAGIPAKKIGDRKTNIYVLERQLGRQI